MSTPSVKTPDQMSAETISQFFPFDERLYFLEGEELAFMKAQTGIEDEEELKKHIVAVTKEAYSVFPYPCIRRYAFVKFKLSRLPGYDRLIQLGKEREDAVLLDRLLLSVGNDVRNAAADGFPANQIVASDLNGEYWPLGHRLFRSTPESFPAKFIPGDAFDPALLAVVPPIYEANPGPIPALASLTSLNPLHGHVAAIHASSFFHLFDEEKQAHLAHALAGLLSPLPGSMIIGSHGAAPEKGFRTETVGGEGGAESGPMTMFCHSPESWTALWDGQVFRKGAVRVETKLVEHSTLLTGRVVYFLQWCVTRL